MLGIVGEKQIGEPLGAVVLQHERVRLHGAQHPVATPERGGLEGQPLVARDGRNESPDVVVERELLALYADPSVDTKPEALAQRGGAFYSEAAIEVLSGLVRDTGETRVVNVRNDGTLPFLPDDHVIEVPAQVNAMIERFLATDVI